MTNSEFTAHLFFLNYSTLIHSKSAASQWNFITVCEVSPQFYIIKNGSWSDIVTRKIRLNSMVSWKYFENTSGWTPFKLPVTLLQSGQLHNILMSSHYFLKIRIGIFSKIDTLEFSTNCKFLKFNFTGSKFP